MGLKQSFRSILRNKIYSLLNIFGLAVGIASAALILLWVEDEVNFDRIYPNSENLYVLGNTDQPNDNIYTSFISSNPLAESLSSDFSGIKGITRSDKATSALSADKVSAFKEAGCFVDPTFFSMFGVKTRGNATTAFATPGSIVISEKLAKKLFGKEDPIGKSIYIDGVSLGYVSDVFQNFPGNSSFQYEWLRPFDEYLQQLRINGLRGNVDNWFSHWLTAYVELEPSTNVAVVNQNLSTFFKEKNNNSNLTPFVYPLSDMRLYGEFVDGKPTGGGYISTIRLFAGIACVILLIACINYMNLSTARSGKRATEVGVCKALGAKRGRLVSQFMRESGLITFASLLIAVLLAWLSLPAFNQLVEKNLSMQLLKPLHLLGLLGIGVICTFLAGSYPSFYLSSFSPLATLKKDKIQLGGGVAWLRKGLVIFQFAVAVILICTTSVIYLQIKHTQNRPLGYDKEQVVMIDANYNIATNFSTIQHELKNTGYVVDAALSHGSILDINSSGSGYGWKSKPDDVNPVLTRMYVCPGFVETVGFHVIEGRGFSAENEADKGRIIINRHLADLMGEEGHVGNMISRGGSNYEIVGIIDNFVFNDIYKTIIEPVIIFNLYYMPQGVDLLYVRIKSESNMQQAIHGIETVWKRFAGSDPFTYTFMDEAFDRMFKAQQREGTLAGIFSALAVFISCLGLFGLSAFSAEQRTKEVGIRKVMGASVIRLTSLLTVEFIKQVLIAVIIATPIAWWLMSKWLQSFAYRIGIPWWIFITVGILACIIALVTVGGHAVRAAMANPVKSIKAE